MDRNNKTRFERRTVLKTLGAGAVATSTVGSSIGSANQQPPKAEEKVDALLEAARQVGRRQGPLARVRFLRNHGIPTTIKQAEFQFPAEKIGEDEVSTEKVDCVEPTQCDADIEVYLSFSYLGDLDQYYAEAMMRMRYMYTYSSGYYYMLSGGEDPDDGLGFQWEKDHWKVRNPDDLLDSTKGDSHIGWDDGSWNQQGLAFRVHDYDMCVDNGPTGDTYEWTPYEYAGVYLEQDDGFQEDDPITASYLHTWKGTVSSFSVSFPAGISVGVGNNVEAEDFQTNPNGDTLRVTISEAYPE